MQCLVVSRSFHRILVQNYKISKTFSSDLTFTIHSGNITIVIKTTKSTVVQNCNLKRASLKNLYVLNLLARTICFYFMLVAPYPFFCNSFSLFDLFSNDLHSFHLFFLTLCRIAKSSKTL